MSAGVLEILFISVSMFAATVGIGMIPLYFKLSDERVHIISLFGIGMLLSTSFMLVIPEGIESMKSTNPTMVGFNLLFGFIAVYAIDKWVHVVSHRFSGLDETESFSSYKEFWNVKKLAKLMINNPVIFALVVHGISDGIALGATTRDDNLVFLMLLAIMIHKIPATLSLTTIQMTSAAARLDIVANLISFALSAPVGFVIVSILNLGTRSIEWLTGNLLLMSGGSLLYASFTAFSHTHGPQVELPYDDSLYVLSGTILPILISFIKE